MIEQNPYYTRQDGPHPKFLKEVNPGANNYSDLAPVIAGIIVAAVGAAATTATAVISSQSAKKQAQKQKEAQIELAKIQAAAQEAADKKNAESKSKMAMYFIAGLIILVVGFIIFKRKTG